ncbi:hypothetical protein J4216_01700 [Candidatus Woesearchaeota archaeon]|nr:hypothetical protein [Candidatus Woesearchaeota archaeon]
MFFRNLFLVVVSFLLIISFVNASDFEINLYKNDYGSFETVQFEVFTNLSLNRDLSVSDIVLLDMNNNSLNIIKNKVKINNTFYAFYFDLPQVVSGEYMIGFKNINYIEKGILKRQDFFSNLKIVNKSSVSIRPGYFYQAVNSGDEVPFVLVFSNKMNNSVSISLVAEGGFFSLDESNFNLAPDKSKNVQVRTSLFNKRASRFNGRILVDYGSGNYIIPFIIDTNYVEKSENNNDTNVKPDDLAKKNIDLTGINDAIYLTRGSGIKLINISLPNTNIGDYYPPGQIVVVNNASVDLHNLSYYTEGFDDDLFEIEPSKISFLSANNSISFSFGFKDSSNLKPGNYYGTLKVRSAENAFVSIPVSLNVLNKSINVQVDNEINNSVNNSFVEFNKTTIKNGDEGGYGFILLFIFLIIFLLIIFIVYRKMKPKKDKFEGFVESVQKRKNY